MHVQVLYGYMQICIHAHKYTCTYMFFPPVGRYDVYTSACVCICACIYTTFIDMYRYTGLNMYAVCVCIVYILMLLVLVNHT